MYISNPEERNGFKFTLKLRIIFTQLYMQPQNKCTHDLFSDKT